MPSVDVIRNITIRGKTDGIDDATAALNRLTESIKSANDNLAKNNAVAQDNAAGFRLTGEGAASAANHLRQAAEAAYLFSPAFRGVVNEMAVPALKGAGVALEGVATGIVTATNVAGTGLISLAASAEKLNPNFLAATSSVRSAGLAMEAFSPTVGGAAVSIASKLLPALSLLGKGLLIVDAIRLVAQAWQLGGEKLAEYVAISEKASAANVTTDFLQRITKAAEEAKLPVEALTAALKKLNDSTAGRLGGSAAQQQLNSLASYGNFAGNSGVAQLQGANGAEEKLRALVNLFDQAVAKGERLAALDLVRTTLGDEIAKKAADDAGYMDKILESADEIAQRKLISAVDIANAKELADRLDAAEKILSQRWHPIQDILTNLGIRMREVWVGIVEAVAKAFDWIAKIVEKIPAIPPAFWNSIGRSVNAAALAAPGPIGPLAGAAVYGARTLLAGDSAAEAQRAEEARNGVLMADARQRLAEGLNRKFDTSKTKPVEEDTAAFDRAEEALRRYAETTEATAGSIDLTTAAQERLKAIAQLTAAGMKDGLTREAAAAKAEMSGLADQAGRAADRLARAQIASETRFNRNTGLLSADDVAIAQRLKGIYPDVASALKSVEAEAMRTNNAFKAIGSAIEINLTQGLTDIVTGSKKAGQAAADMGLAIVKAIDQMIIKLLIVEPLMRSLQSLISGTGLFNFGSSAGSASSVGAAGIGGIGGLYHAGGIVGAEATSTRYVHPAYFDRAPRFHGGGIAGDEVPIIARRGEGVFTQGQMAAMGGSNVQVNVINNANGTQVESKQRHENGIDITDVIISTVNQGMAAGAFDKTNSARYGVRPQARGR